MVNTQALTLVLMVPNKSKLEKRWLAHITTPPMHMKVLRAAIATWKLITLPPLHITSQRVMRLLVATTIKKQQNIVATLSPMNPRLLITAKLHTTSTVEMPLNTLTPRTQPPMRLPRTGP
jgi:hypothetical protein